MRGRGFAYRFGLKSGIYRHKQRVPYDNLKNIFLKIFSNKNRSFTDKKFFLKKLHSYAIRVNLTYMKKCSKCLETKPLIEFYKKIRYTDGYDYTCKQCQRPGENERNKRPKSNHIKTVSRELRKLEQARVSLALGNISQEKYNEVLWAYKESKRDSQNERQRKRYKSDPAFRAIRNVRSRLKRFLNSKNKYSKSLGCSVQELRSHIEHQFQSGMSWENYGMWELDHVIPLALAFQRGPEAFTEACNYKNLQPLWKIDHDIKTRKDVDLIKSSNQQ